MELTYDVIINTDGAKGSAKELEAIFKRLEESSDKGAQSLGQYGKSLMSDFQNGKISVEEFVRELDKLKSKAVEISVVGDSLDVSKQSARAKDSISDLLDHITKSEQYALSAIRRATNDFITGSKDWFSAKDWGFSGKQINKVIDCYEAGEISAGEFLDKVRELQDGIEKGLDEKKVIDKDTKSLKSLNEALKQVAKNQSIIDKAGGKKEDKAETPEKAGKKLSSFANLASRSFGGVARSIAKAFSGGLVGAAFIALFAYFKGLLKWNKTLIGLKWGDFKDQMKVLFGYMKEEDALTASIKRRTDAINEETKALQENVKAQKDANAPLAKARAIMERKASVNDAFKNIVGDREFHFFGGARAKDIQDVLDMVSGDANKRAVKKYFETMSDAGAVEKMSQKQLDDLQFELEKALQLSDKQKEVNKALDEWNKVAGFEEDAYGAIALQQTDAKNNLERANKAYDETLKYYEQIAKKRKQIENTLSSQTMAYELGDLRQKMSNLGLKDIGGTDWAKLQSAIDNLDTATNLRNDNRGWTLREYDRLLEKKKKNIEISGTEQQQTKKLGAEIDTLAAKIQYLNNNGVVSRTQRLMTEALELEKRRLEVERENAAYKEQTEILEHILGLKRQENTIRGLADSELRNLDLEIDNIQRKLAMLGSQKSLSAEEKREMGTLNTTLAAKRNEREDLALKKHNEELERQASIQQRLLSIEKERNRLYDNRNGRTDEEIEHDELRINVQMAEEDLKLAQQKVDALQAQKEQYEESEDAIRDGVQWTHEEQKALEDANVALWEKTVALQKAKDAEASYQGVVVQAIDVDKQRVDALNELADGFRNIGSAISDNLGDNSMSKISEGLADIGDTASKIYEYSHGEKMSPADAIASMAQFAQFMVSQGTAIADTQKRLKESADAWKQSVEDVAHEYTMIKLDELEYKQQNIFGVEDPYKKLQDNAKKYEEASKATRTALERLANEGMIKTGQRAKEDVAGVAQDALSGAAMGAMAGFAAGTVIPGIGNAVGTAVGAIVGTVGGFITGIFKNKEMVDVFDNLKSKFGEVFDPDTLEINKEILASYDQLDDRTKKLVDNYKELKERMDEASEEFKQFAAEMFGDIGNALADSLLKAFRNDDLYQSVHDFHDYVKQQMETLISSKIYNAVFGKMFDGLDAKVNEALENYSLTGGNVDFVGLLGELPYKTEQLIGAYGTLMKQAQEALPDWDMFNPTDSQEALRGSIASMSEDTANKLNGNFMGLKLSAMEINTKMSGVRSLMEENQSIMGRSLSALHQIADNTAHLLRIDESIADMRNEMINNGVRVR
jgi:hypothetical protein